MIRLSNSVPTNNLNPGTHKSKLVVDWIDRYLSNTPFKFDREKTNDKYALPNHFEIHRHYKSISEHEDNDTKDTTQFFAACLFKQVGGNTEPRPIFSAYLFNSDASLCKKSSVVMDINKVFFFNQRKAHSLDIPEGSECYIIIFPVLKR